MLEMKDYIISYYSNKYEIDEFDIQLMYDSAIEILFNLLYPFNFEIKEIPANILSRYKSWIIRAIQEFIERNGMTSYLNYSENGISMNFGRAQLSQSLIDEITPFGGVI